MALKSPPGVGTLYELERWPDFPDTEKRRWIALIAVKDLASRTYVAAPLTTQMQCLDANQRVDLSPFSTPSIYRLTSPSGLPPKKSCIGLMNYRNGLSAISNVVVWEVANELELPNGVTIKVHQEKRASKEDWDIILRGVPDEHKQKFHSYDAEA